MTIREQFLKRGEYYAAGLFEEEERSVFYRKALALRRYYEHCPLHDYRGEKLYPSGVCEAQMSVVPHYCHNGLSIRWERVKEDERALFERIADSPLCAHRSFVPPMHTVAGNMYNHSMPNYERVLAEGLNGYEKRVAVMQDREMREGLLHVIAGIRAYHARCLAFLEERCADAALLEALRVVPFEPCRNITQAIVCWNFVMYLDGCDNLGSLAQGLAPYARGEDVSALLENLYDNLDANGGYSMALGMEKNALIQSCIRAARGKRRPMIELFVDEDTPEDVWEEALSCVLTGGGQPAFYNRQLFHDQFLKRFPTIKPQDVKRLCGGGCTEMMLPGLSNVGSLDAGVNLLWIFERVMQEKLEHAECFEAFYEAYLAAAREETIGVMESIARTQAHRAAHCPLPMRTLLTDDCIARERDYNDGGARYAWSIISFAGIVNVIDSLMTIKEMIFEKKTCTAAQMLEKLRANDADFLSACKQTQRRYGVDDDAANALGKDLTRRVFDFTKERMPHIGLGFLPSSILFRSYGDGGKDVGATPCGRASGEALADSLGAIFGKDTLGATALLKSVTSLELSEAIGTPVVNLTISPSFDKKLLKSLILTYMKLGGMQLQISCVSKAMLEEAYHNPDAHRNLVVRVGGFSEYFCRLDDTLKRKVLERTYY